MEVGDDGVPRRKRDGVRVVEVPVTPGFSIRSLPALLRASVIAPPAAALGQACIAARRHRSSCIQAMLAVISGLAACRLRTTLAERDYVSLGCLNLDFMHGRRNRRRNQQSGVASSGHATGDVPAGPISVGTSDPLLSMSTDLCTWRCLSDEDLPPCTRCSTSSYWHVCCPRGAAAMRELPGMPANMLEDPVACSLVEVNHLPVLPWQTWPVCCPTCQRIWLSKRTASFLSLTMLRSPAGSE